MRHHHIASYSMTALGPSNAGSRQQWAWSLASWRWIRMERVPLRRGWIFIVSISIQTVHKSGVAYRVTGMTLASLTSGWRIMPPSIWEPEISDPFNLNMSCIIIEGDLYQISPCCPRSRGRLFLSTVIAWILGSSSPTVLPVNGTSTSIQVREPNLAFVSLYLPLIHGKALLGHS